MTVYGLLCALALAAALFLAPGLDFPRGLCYYVGEGLVPGAFEVLHRVSCTRGVRGQYRALHLGGWGALFFWLRPS